MDALRRAEHEKQRREQRENAAGDAVPPAAPPDPRFAGPDDETTQIESDVLADASDAFERGLLELDDSRVFATDEAGDDSSAFDLAKGVDAAAESVSELALEPLDGAGDRDAAAEADGDDVDDGDFIETLPPIARRAPPAYGGAAAAGATATFGSTAFGARERDEQTGTLPSSRARSSDLDDYFERSQSMEVPHAPSGGVPDHTLEDVAAHTVVGAHTVFEASRRPRANRLVQGIAALAIVTVLGIGGVALFYARHRTEAPPPLPSPLVASGVERAPARELPVVSLGTRPAPRDEAALPRVDTRSEAPAPSGARAVDEGAGAARPATALAATPPAAPALAPAPAASLPEPSPEPPSSPATPASPMAAPGALTTAATPSPSTPARAASTPPPAPADVSLLADVNAGEVRIARSRRPAGVEPGTAAAYAAYASGDLVTAEARYRALLETAPGRRDALLGLGAVALARGDRESAFEHYAAVLERYPDDAVASAALVSLTGGHGAATAARLRLLLDRHGEQPYLHFALANWYARQGRWGDAQQAYFAAFSRDDANPDYAFNLAVSLDRMGQAAAALNYYREALALSDARPARFDPANALERIGALEASLAPPVASP